MKGERLMDDSGWWYLFYTAVSQPVLLWVCDIRRIWFVSNSALWNEKLRYAKSGQQPEGCMNAILEKPSFLERSDCRDCTLQFATLLHFSHMSKFSGFHVEWNNLLPYYSHNILSGIKCYNHAIKNFFQTFNSIIF